MKTISYNPDTHRLVPVEREYMFNVEVENTANAVFDTAEEAVDYARHYVYMNPVRFQEAVDTLNSGQVFHFSYGFTAANLVPVAKRSAAPQPEPVDVAPVAYYTDQGGWPRICLAVDGNHDGYETPLYTAPPDYEEIKRQLEECRKDAERFAVIAAEADRDYVEIGTLEDPYWHRFECKEDLIEWADATLASVKGGV